MTSARRFFKSRAAFTLLPLGAAFLHLGPWVNPSFATAILAIYGAWTLLSIAEVRWVGLVPFAGWLLLRVQATRFASWEVAGTLGYLGLLSIRRPTSRMFRPFFRPARPKGSAHFEARSEDSALLHLQPAIPGPSKSHGLLRGANVVIWTVESMPRDRIGSSPLEGALTPFIERLRERGVSSQHHFCLCPLTNNVHIILYASDYSDVNGFGPIAALRRAGYQTVYMTSCDTREYGLRGILERAGFDRVLDRSVLRNDAALPSSGLENFTALIDRTRPFFLHVHTANTHVPYRLSDPQKFSRFDSRADLGRFLNGLEEADWLLSRFVEGLDQELGGDPPLWIVSADHGQSFGEFGYQTHGSSVVKSQQLVPCIFEHPRLKPARVEYSSHLDVLPSVLDLLGIEVDCRCFGASILGERSAPAWLLWAGHPSRSRTSHFGLVHRRRKLMLDCVVDRCYHMGWDDELAQELFGEEKAYYSALIARIATQLKVE